jgi:UDP-N-acetylmuramyl pentapeptide synthase
MHAMALRNVLAVRPDRFVAVGPEFATALKQMPQILAATILTASNSSEASALIRNLVCPGDVLLVKGSRGIAMERVFENLTPL